MASPSRRAALKHGALLLCALGIHRGPHAQAARDEHPGLPRIDDLRQLAVRIRGERIPLLLFFSTPGCPYCIEVRRNYLAPRLTEDAGRLLIREVEIDSRRSFTGLDGGRLTEAELAARFKVRMVPVVQLVGADLLRLGRPLVGIDAAGFYESYLSAAIEQAQRTMRGG
jgi:thiol-disulfide isomerase/thioredoxin